MNMTSMPETDTYTQEPRRRSHRRPSGKDPLFTLRNILNIIFMLAALAGVVVYVWVDNTTGTYIVLGAMAIKMVECCLRILR